MPELYQILFGYFWTVLLPAVWTYFALTNTRSFCQRARKISPHRAVPVWGRRIWTKFTHLRVRLISVFDMRMCGMTAVGIAVPEMPLWVPAWALGGAVQCTMPYVTYSCSGGQEATWCFSPSPSLFVSTNGCLCLPWEAGCNPVCMSRHIPLLNYFQLSRNYSVLLLTVSSKRTHVAGLVLHLCWRTGVVNCIAQGQARLCFKQCAAQIKMGWGWQWTQRRKLAEVRLCCWMVADAVFSGKWCLFIESFCKFVTLR